MPHQRKYVAHSGGIDACPSRAKRSMAAYASHGFSSRLSRSARCALLSFTSLTLASAETERRGTDRSFVTRLSSSTATYRLDRPMLTPRTSAEPPHRPSWVVAATMPKLYIPD